MSRPPQRIRVGLIGCGAINAAYLETLSRFPALVVSACADIVPARAAQTAAQFNIARACSVDELLQDDLIDVVLNLTVPAAHAEVSLAALEHGRHVYSEKPLAIDREGGSRIAQLAREKNLRVGCAPDTFMGSGLETAKHFVNRGAIGRPVAATAFMMIPGHESWHPDPAFYYAPGGGPLLDMGPYYITALLNLLGPAKRVSAMATIAIPARTITSQPRAGQQIDVTVPDHVAGTIEFERGAIATMVMSFATHFAPYDGAHPITIFGDQGTMLVPDPNQFDGSVMVRTIRDKDFAPVEAAFPRGLARGVGLADMIDAINESRPHRASLEQAMATLDVMQCCVDSAREGRAISVSNHDSSIR